MKRIAWLAPACAVALLAQDRSGIAREGKYWVDTVTGTLQVEQSLQVTSNSAITVQGSADARVTYTLKRRAKAGSESDARALLDRIAIKPATHGGWTVVQVILPDQGRTSAELKLQVPRRLREVALATGGGAVKGLDLDGTFRADTGGGAVEVDRVLGAVTVRTGGGAVRVGSIGGRLECASGGGAITAESLGGESNIQTGGGEIVVREAKGPVHARTGGGSIRVERALQGVQVAAGAGLIDVAEAGGPVVAETGSGSIKIRSASNVRCESGAGTIRIQAVSGGLHAATKAGSIVAELAGAGRFQDSALTTSMGDITVLIPSKLAVTIEAVNATPGSHRIVSDFPEVRPRSEQGNERSSASGAINGGGPVLRLTATGGTIYVRHQQ